jgi:hypothetical protein
MWMVGLILRNQSWATEAMKRCDEALNASSLQFLCQRQTLHRFIALIFCRDQRFSLHCFLNLPPLP